MKPVEKTIYEYLCEYSEKDGNKPLLIDENGTYTVKETLCAVDKTIFKLNACGVKRGDYVVLRTTRSIRATILFLALQTLGVVTVLCDPFSTIEEFLKNNNVKREIDFLLSNEKCSRQITAGDGFELCNFKNGETWSLDADEFSKNEEITVVKACKETTVIIFTSGSTGVSKGVKLSQYNLINNLVDSYPLGWYLQEDIAMVLVPLHHVFGIALLLGALVNRHALFFPSNTDVDSILTNIEKYKVTRMNGVPTLFYAMASSSKLEEVDISSLRTGFIGGGPWTKEQFAFIEEKLKITLIPVYGMSECIGISCASYQDSFEDRASGTGRFYSMNSGSILDEKGQDVPVGKEGEICVKGVMLTSGYCEESQTREAIDKNGWFHTGDLGYLDEKGIVHITGRIKDIIIRGGNNLSAQKIENAILSLPYIYAASVVGIADEKYGEVPAAMLVFKPGETRCEEAVIKDLGALLCKNELPAVLKIVENIPLTSSGKPDKQTVKKELSVWKA